MVFLPAVQWLVSASADGTIKIFDRPLFDETTLVATLQGHSSAVHGLAWIAQCSWLVSGSTDGTIKVWRVQSE